MPSHESWPAQLLRFAVKHGPPGDPGHIYSELFIHTLESLRREGKIVGWIRTKHDSNDDRAGVDFWLTLPEGSMPLGITSTPNHRREREHKHRKVPQVRLRLQKTYELVPERLVRDTIEHDIDQWRKRQRKRRR